MMHTLAIKVEHMVNDERFWPSVLAVVLVGLFVGLLIWAGLYGEASPNQLPAYPFSPYTY